MDSTTKAPVKKVLAVDCRNQTNLNYLVELEDGKTELIDSHEAKEICEAKILEFYTNICTVYDNQVYVPAEYCIWEPASWFDDDD